MSERRYSFVALALLASSLANALPLQQAAPVRDYKIALEEFYVSDCLVEGEGGYFRWSEGRVARFNRTSRLMVLNVNATLLHDLPSAAWVEVTAYQKQNNNRYSMIPMRVVQMSVCDILRHDLIFYKDMASYGNLPAECPVLKGEYYLKDFYVDSKHLPPTLPGERWKMVSTMRESKNSKVALCTTTTHLLLDRFF